MGVRTQLKRMLIQSGLYHSSRRIYHQLLPTKTRGEHRRQIEFYSEFVGVDDLVFDVGANIGAKSEVFLDLGARVISFEPQLDCCAEAHARCGSNSRLTIVAAAVGKQSGEATLFVSGQSATSSFLPNWNNDTLHELSVPVVTLDSMIAKYGLPRFCKIDVEGFELDVLLGLSHPLPMISLEYHLNNVGVVKTLACLDRLESWGPLSLNITKGEEPGLFWSEWVSLEHFRRIFPDHAPRSSTCSYGDILIRSEACDSIGGRA